MENNSIKLNFYDFCNNYFNVKNNKFVYEIKKIFYINEKKYFVISNDFFTNSVNDNVKNKIKKLKSLSFYIDNIFYDKDNENVNYYLSLYPVDLRIFFKNISEIKNNYSLYFYKLYKDLPYKNINNIYGIKYDVNYDINIFFNLLNENKILFDDIIIYNNENYKYIKIEENKYIYIIFKIKSNGYYKLYNIIKKLEIEFLKNKLFIPVTDIIYLYK